jgi:hypothetical protein
VREARPHLILGVIAVATFALAVVTLRGARRLAIVGGAGTTLGARFLAGTERLIEACAEVIAAADAARWATARRSC